MNVIANIVSLLIGLVIYICFGYLVVTGIQWLLAMFNKNEK